MTHSRATLNPADFHVDSALLNPWANPEVPDEEGVRYVLETGSIYGTPDRVRGQIEELRDAGVYHVMCQMSFGDMAHDKIIASMRRFGEYVMPAFP